MCIRDAYGNSHGFLVNPFYSAPQRPEQHQGQHYIPAAVEQIEGNPRHPAGKSRRRLPADSGHPAQRHPVPRRGPVRRKGAHPDLHRGGGQPGPPPVRLHPQGRPRSLHQRHENRPDYRKLLPKAAGLRICIHNRKQCLDEEFFRRTRRIFAGILGGFQENGTQYGGKRPDQAHV